MRPAIGRRASIKMYSLFCIFIYLPRRHITITGYDSRVMAISSASDQEMILSICWMASEVRESLPMMAVLVRDSA